MKKSKLILSLVSLIVLAIFLSFFYFSHEIRAQISSPVIGFATIVNSNHIVFSGNNGGSTGNIPFSVQYDTVTGDLSGYAWSDDYGWVDFNSVNLDLTTFEMSGTAKVLSLQNPNDTESAEWANGTISLSGSNGGSTGNMPFSVTFNPDGAPNTTWHWAWGGNVLGWIDFSNVVVGAESLLPVVNISANPTFLIMGSSSTLTWLGNNLAPTGCVATGGSGGWPALSRPSSGSWNTGPLAIGTYTFSIKCLGVGVNSTVSSTDSALVKVYKEGTCLDPNANNFGEIGECTYDIILGEDVCGNMLGIQPVLPTNPAMYFDDDGDCQYVNFPLCIVNSIRDGNETSIDCGGIDCPACSKIPHYRET